MTVTLGTERSVTDDDDLPSGWARAALKEVATPRTEDVQPADFPDLRYVGLEHLVSGRCTLDASDDASKVRSVKSRFYADDVLYGKLRPYLDKAVLAPWDGMSSTDMIVLTPSPAALPSFLAYLLHTKPFIDHAMASSRGVQLPRTSWKEIREFEFALPPLAEQRRIVAALDAGMARVNAARERLARTRAVLKRYRAAVLSAAVEGRLTEDWRATHQDAEPAEALLRRILDERRRRWEEAERARYAKTGKTPPLDWRSRYQEPAAPETSELPELPEGWCWTNLGRIAGFQNGRAFPSKEYATEGVRLLRPGNMFVDGSVRWTDENTRLMPIIWAERYPEHIIHGRELVMNLTAQSLKDQFLGRVCLTDDQEYCLLNQRIARITPVSDIDDVYILYTLKSPLFRQFVDSLNTGSLIEHMFTSQLSDAVVPLPPSAEQKEIGKRMSRTLKLADAVEVRVERAARQVEQLGQALLAKAFRGELVPQDPADEPAALALARVRRPAPAARKGVRNGVMGRRAAADSAAHRPTHI